MNGRNPTMLSHLGKRLQILQAKQTSRLYSITDPKLTLFQGGYLTRLITPLTRTSVGQLMGTIRRPRIIWLNLVYSECSTIVLLRLVDSWLDNIYLSFSI